MTVAAANVYKQLTEYSSYGFTNGVVANGEDVIKPDIMAPGGSRYYGNIFGPGFQRRRRRRLAVDSRTNDYSLKSGTSMAAPYVAGCAAVLIDAWQQAGHSWTFGSDADPLFIKMLLCATATESGFVREYNPGTAGPAVNSPSLGRAAAPKDPAEG